jgi:hypothetical protein
MTETRGQCEVCGVDVGYRVRRSHRWAVLDVLMPYPWRLLCPAHLAEVNR